MAGDKGENVSNVPCVYKFHRDLVRVRYDPFPCINLYLRSRNERVLPGFFFNDGKTREYPVANPRNNEILRGQLVYLGAKGAPVNVSANRLFP